MRKNWKNKLLILLVFLLPLAFTSCQENDKGETAAGEIEYTCPMHPQIVRDEPGSCPICGMNLVAKQPFNTAGAIVSTDLNYLLQPTNQAVVSAISTTRPVQKELQNEIIMNGVITYDTRRQYTIPARYGGRIEKLYVQFNYQPVRKGQKLYDIYSPELVTAQKELLYLLQHDQSNSLLIQGARQKLRLLGVTEDQINQLIQTGREKYTFPVLSPYTGYVLDPSVTTAPTAVPAPAAPAAGDGMGGMNTPANSSSVGAGGSLAGVTPGGGFAIREGMYVSTGQALLKVVDASQVWAEFNVASVEAGRLKKGTPVTITFNQLPAETVQAQVSLIEPVYEAGDNFAQVRVALPAQNKLTLIGQLITGKTAYSTGTTIWLPKEAVLDLGSQSVAFLKTKGGFKPVSVQAGQRTGDQVEVIKGLTSQDQVAANAQFLVDSESFIRIADRK